MNLLKLSENFLKDLILENPPHKIRGFLESDDIFFSIFLKNQKAIFRRYISLDYVDISFEEFIKLSEYYSTDSSSILQLNRLIRLNEVEQIGNLSKYIPKNKIISSLISAGKIYLIEEIYLKLILNLYEYLPAYYEYTQFYSKKKEIIYSTSEPMTENMETFEDKDKGKNIIKEKFYERKFEPLNIDIDIDILLECNPLKIKPKKLAISFKGSNLNSLIFRNKTDIYSFVGILLENEDFDVNTSKSYFVEYPKLAKFCYKSDKLKNLIMRYSKDNFNIFESLQYVKPRQIKKLMSGLQIDDNISEKLWNVANECAVSGKGLLAVIIFSYCIGIYNVNTDVVIYPSLFGNDKLIYEIYCQKAYSVSPEAIKYYSFNLPLKNIDLFGSIYSVNYNHIVGISLFSKLIGKKLINEDVPIFNNFVDAYVTLDKRVLLGIYDINDIVAGVLLASRILDVSSVYYTKNKKDFLLISTAE